MSGSNDIFDTKKIRRLVQLMQEHELTEIDLKQGEQQIRLRRGSDTRNDLIEWNGGFTSPMVGTFYASPNPESPSYVKVGDHVGPDSTVCIVEAMKVFNEIPAGLSGKIVAVLVENGDPVEFGQPIFKVDASA